MLTDKTSLHDAIYRHVEENVNPGLVIAEPGESNLYFLFETVVIYRRQREALTNLNRIGVHLITFDRFK